MFESFTCHGIVYGFVGLFNNDKLILIKESVSIGRLPFGAHDEVFKIQKICVIPLRCKNDFPFDLDLDVSFILWVVWKIIYFYMYFFPRTVD